MYRRFISWHFGADTYDPAFPVQMDSGILPEGSELPAKTREQVDLSAAEFRFSQGIVQFLLRYTAIYLLVSIVYVAAALVNRVLNNGHGLFGVYFGPGFEAMFLLCCCAGTLFCPVLWILARRARIGIDRVEPSFDHPDDWCFRFVVRLPERPSVLGRLAAALVRPLLPSAVFRLKRDVQRRGNTAMAEFIEDREDDGRTPFEGTLVVQRR